MFDYLFFVDLQGTTDTQVSNFADRWVAVCLFCL